MRVEGKVGGIVKEADEWSSGKVDGKMEEERNGCMYEGEKGGVGG